MLFLTHFSDARKAERAANDSLYHFCWDCSSSSLNASRDLAASCSVETFAFCSFSAADFTFGSLFSLLPGRVRVLCRKRLLYISWAISTYSPAASLLFFYPGLQLNLLPSCWKFWRASASFCWFLTASSIVWPFSCFNFSSAPRMRSPYFLYPALSVESFSIDVCCRCRKHAVALENSPSTLFLLFQQILICLAVFFQLLCCFPDGFLILKL